MKIVFLILAMSCLSTPAHAVLEAKAFGGITFINPASMNSRLANSGITQIYVTAVYGVDVLLRFPMSPVGLGIRYDWQGVKVKATSDGPTGNEFELSSTRTAVVGSLRFLESAFGYAGLIGTYGLTHKPTIRISESENVTSFDTSAKSTSGTIGIEGGTKITALMMGAEVGYQNYLIQEITGPSGSANFDINFCGFYGMIHVGLGF